MRFGRRSALAGGVIVTLLAASQQAVAQNDLPVAASSITVESGQLDGKMLESGVRAYLGIPYAAPPARELRWREPQPPAQWPGIYHADRFGPQCMQPQRGILTNQYSGAEITSEDCLYLNVWAKPELREAPVIVFLHGGGFFVGSGSMPLYSGENLARQDVVAVNLNYRLGPLGFLAHPELSSESPHGVSGNYGFLDQIAALEWIQDNIVQFGGDPSNVTIVGQSAGSMSVLALQASPLAKGLFHRAVGMSGALIGSAGPSDLRPLAVAEQDGARLQEIWQADSLAELRSLPADRLVAPRAPGSPPVGPIQDGFVLPDRIEDVFALSAQNDVPLILGFTRDESFGGLGPVDSLSDYQAKARAAFGERADEFLALYPAGNDQEARTQARAADRDGTMVAAMDLWARAQVENGKAPVYSYMFARPHSYADGVMITNHDTATAGAYHTSEVPFWLGTLESFNRFRPMRDWTAADRELSDAMMRSLVAFSRSGSPQTNALNWVPFDPDNSALLELGRTVRAGHWPDLRKLEFFRELKSRLSQGDARD